LQLRPSSRVVIVDEICVNQRNLRIASCRCGLVKSNSPKKANPNHTQANPSEPKPYPTEPKPQRCEPISLVRSALQILCYNAECGTEGFQLSV
jgi:hypothetical protein